MKKYECIEDKIYDGDRNLEIIWDIQDYADRRNNFNCEFVDSVANYLETYGFITNKQYNILLDIYTNFKIGTFDPIEDIENTL